MILNAMKKVNENFLREDNLSPYEINDGFCEDWAEQVFEILSKSENDVQIWATLFGFADTSHVFLRINDKFYDAECLDGCLDHMELPIFSKLIGFKRQPVWLENINHNNDIIENKRDTTPEMIKEYNEIFGTNN